MISPDDVVVSGVIPAGGLSDADIAELFGVSRAAVHWIRVSAERKLFDELRTDPVVLRALRGART